MTLVAIPELMLFETDMPDAANNTLLDASGEKFALVFQPPKAGSIDRVGFNVGTVTLGDTVDVRIETLAADGTPSGTLWATNTNGSVVVAAASTGYEATLTASATVDTDDFVALVVVQGALGNFNMRGMGIAASSPPYRATFLGGAWAKSSVALPCMWIRYTDGSYVYIPGVLPGVPASLAFNSTTTPDEVGMKITVPIDCKVRGIWWYNADSTSCDATFKLYDNADVLLESIALDADVYGIANARQLVRAKFDTEVTLNAGDVVRATILATTATSNTIWRIPSLFSDAIATAYPHAGAAIGTERTDAGAWTDDTDQLYQIGLIISALDDGAGGGGGGARAFSHVG